MTLAKRCGLVFTVLWCSALPIAVQGAAVTGAELQEQIGELLHRTYEADQPGAAVIALRAGEVVFRGAYGMADVELGVPLEPDMVFRLGSITKQFTGAAIAMLEEEGKLSVEDPITRFLPDYPTHGHEITIAQLLAHTSGIRSYTGIAGWMEKRIRLDLSVEELIEGFEHEPMDFAPGAKFLYNNSGYVLLGAIIEKASGMSYETFVETRLFEPLEMRSSFYGGHERIIPRRVAGYDGRPGELRNGQYLSMTQPYAAGSLLSTVDDLAKWDAGLYGGKLLRPESVARMTTPFALANGKSANYGYGLSIGQLRDRPMISHGGGIFGFSTYALRLPEEEIFVAVLSNFTGHPVRPAVVAYEIAALVMGDPFPERQARDLEPEALAPFVGVYRVDEETTYEVTLQEGRLFVQTEGGRRMEIVPESASEFFVEGDVLHMRFIRDGDGAIEGGGDGAVEAMVVFRNGSRVGDRARRVVE